MECSRVRRGRVCILLVGQNAGKWKSLAAIDSNGLAYPARCLITAAATGLVQGRDLPNETHQ